MVEENKKDDESKTIKVSKDTWFALMNNKLIGGFKSMDDYFKKVLGIDTNGKEKVNVKKK